MARADAGSNRPAGPAYMVFADFRGRLRQEGRTPILAILAPERCVSLPLERLNLGGATLLEAVTYRMGPHPSSGDPSKERDPAEGEACSKRDPINRYRAFLDGLGVWSEKEESELQAELDAYVQNGIEEAESAAPPEGIVEDAYAEVPPALARQVDAWKREAQD